MNYITEELDKRESLMPLKHDHLPFADDDSLNDNLHSRKVSLSSRRNVELTVKTQIHNVVANTNIVATDCDLDSQGTDSSESIIIKTPPLMPLSRNLRRNSISMPSGINAIEDLEALRLKHQMQEQEPMVERKTY
ncbi:hypothetical protein EVAR_72216_1 [Eumeta japonica]|uniref:Uncharacterized protein n=1 Tax=Eumeta variegata TaxID=151549 RepID=A0A4C1STJ1_EUMVA|nr:hypothetical protein EVAR_72216_1 [Eumeta japonica]